MLLTVVAVAVAAAAMCIREKARQVQTARKAGKGQSLIHSVVAIIHTVAVHKPTLLSSATLTFAPGLVQ